ncbi:hypothetical protein BS78_09G247300 [Paspalum vaginatum]|nr:hypothetical protein BS78_09G247300 [Paspalum vaginatum]
MLRIIFGLFPSTCSRQGPNRERDLLEALGPTVPSHHSKETTKRTPTRPRPRPHLIRLYKPPPPPRLTPHLIPRAKSSRYPTMEERIIPQPKDPQLEAPSVAAAPAEDSSDEGEFEFEFPFVSRDSPAGTAAPADELFADGRIRPFYPVFGRGGCAARPAPEAAAAEPRVRGRLGRLFLEESLARDSSASSTASTSSSAATDDDGGLDGAAPESYCVWRPGGGASASPAPRPPRKSGSTGSMARWRRISDLVVGRSHSDGKEKFVFFAAPTTSPHDGSSKNNSDRPRPTPPPAPAGGRKPSNAAADVDAAHRLAYLANRGGGTPRRTFLPYREELVGLFANVNGVSRSHQHPF